MKHFATLIGSTFILAACGSSNPGTTTPVVTVPGYDNKPQVALGEQFTASTAGFFKASVEGKPDVLSETIPAGQKDSVSFQIIPVNSDIQEYDVTILSGNLPHGATLKRSSKTTWLFTWNPPINYSVQDIAIKLNIHVKKSSSDITAMQSVSQDVTFHILLSGTSQAPASKGVSADLTRPLNEGDVVPFSVDVQDSVAAQSNQAPEIKAVTPMIMSNHELAPIDGSKFVHADPAHPTVEQVSPGVFRAYFIFDTSAGLPWPKVKSQANVEDKTATTATVCFDIAAKDASTKQNMEPINFCPIVTYAATTPSITWDKAAQFILKAGAPATNLNLNIQSDGKMGKLTYSNLSKNFAKWPGNPTFNCDTVSPTNLACHVNWTPSCSTVSRTYSFAASAALVVDKGARQPSKATLPAQLITVEPDLDNCPVTSPNAKKAAVDVSTKKAGAADAKVKPLTVTKADAAKKQTTTKDAAKKTTAKTAAKVVKNAAPTTPTDSTTTTKTQPDTQTPAAPAAKPGA